MQHIKFVIAEIDMWNKESFVLMLLGIIVFVSVNLADSTSLPKEVRNQLSRGGMPQEAFEFLAAKKNWKYRLSTEGFSAFNGKLLFDIFSDKKGVDQYSFLGVWQPNDTQLALPLMTQNLFDFTWIPGRDKFIAIYDGRMSLFEWSSAEKRYEGNSVQHPIDFDYFYCSCSPEGKWLAVNCYDLLKATGYRLGILNMSTGRFAITDINTDFCPYIWQNENTVQVCKDDNIHEVDVSSDKVVIKKTYKLASKPSWFYGVLNDQPIILKDKTIKLGEKDLIELKHSNKSAALATSAWIFIFQSPRSLMVFNNQGVEISHIQTDWEIKFGSIGENPNTVYGLAGTVVWRISVQSGNVNMQKICDLALLNSSKQ